MAAETDWQRWRRHFFDIWKQYPPSGRGSRVVQVGRCWKDLRAEEQVEWRRRYDRAVGRRLRSLQRAVNLTDRALQGMTAAARETRATASITTYDRSINDIDNFMHWQLTRRKYPAEDTHFWNVARAEICDCRGRAGEVLEDARRELQAQRRTVAEPLSREDLLDDATGDIPAELQGTGWNGGWILGEGGQGHVVLWVQVDAQGNIQDRQAVKETFLDWDAWDSKFISWYQRVPTMIPTEVKALEMLRDKVHAETIIEMRDWAPHYHEDRPFYRMFLEYAPHKDVHTLAVWYETRKPAEGRAFVEPDGRYSKYLPEPFIWRLFDSLVDAAVAMEEAMVDDQVPAQSRIIVHRDIKPNNVLLAAASATVFPDYPTPKLADFGLAIMTHSQDAENPRLYQQAGTDGFRAPEQSMLGYPQGTPPSSIDSKTNVWEIAKNVMAAMSNLSFRQSREADGEQSRDSGYRQPTFLPGDQVPIMPQKALFYSPALRSLVLRCLAFDPNDRPDVQELRREIQRNTGGAAAGPNDVDLAKGLRNGSQAGGAAIQPLDRLRIEQTPFQMAHQIPEDLRDVEGMMPYVQPDA